MLDFTFLQNDSSTIFNNFMKSLTSIFSKCSNIFQKKSTFYFAFLQSPGSRRRRPTDMPGDGGAPACDTDKLPGAARDGAMACRGSHGRQRWHVGTHGAGRWRGAQVVAVKLRPWPQAARGGLQGAAVGRERG
jgi:hypothetical protein